MKMCPSFNSSLKLKTVLSLYLLLTLIVVLRMSEFEKRVSEKMKINIFIFLVVY